MHYLQWFIENRKRLINFDYFIPNLVQFAPCHEEYLLWFTHTEQPIWNETVSSLRNRNVLCNSSYDDDEPHPHRARMEAYCVHQFQWKTKRNAKAKQTRSAIYPSWKTLRAEFVSANNFTCEIYSVVLVSVISPVLFRCCLSIFDLACIRSALWNRLNGNRK